MKIALFSVFFSLLLFTSSAFANESLCPKRLEGHENIQVSQHWDVESSTCYLSISPRDAYKTLIYRDYLLNNRGLFFVFNSFTPQEGFASSGAREFYFFPSAFSGFQWAEDGDSFVVNGWDGLELRFSLATGQIQSIGGQAVELAESVSPANRGGVEFPSPPGLMLDSGFMFGNSPSSNPKAKSLWRNQKGQSCVTLNQEIFFYDAEGESQLRTMAELETILRHHCPDFLL